METITATETFNECFSFNHDNGLGLLQRFHLVGETAPFRSLARELPFEPGATALEIGCSYGDCLQILWKRTSGQAIGFDNSTECVFEAVQRFPAFLRASSGTEDKGSEITRAAVQVLDVLSPEGIAEVEVISASRSVTFVDIGGDRHTETVLKLLRRLQSRVVVVKCRALFTAATKFLESSVCDRCGQTRSSCKALTGMNVADAPASIMQSLQITERPSKAKDLGPAVGLLSCDSDGSINQGTELASWWVSIQEKSARGGDKAGAAGLGVPRWQRKQQRHLIRKQRHQLHPQPIQDQGPQQQEHQFQVGLSTRAAAAEATTKAALIIKN